MKIKIILNIEKELNLELYPEVAPKSVSNFIEHIKKGTYKGVVFHRIIKDFMIQTGGYYIKDNTVFGIDESTPISGEFNSNGFNNNLKHELGVISMARTSDPNSATSQFFICAATCPWLDGEYAAFGRTIDEASNEIILEIANMPTMNIGGGFTDFPQYDIKIIDIELVE